jgi:hypothetical protein
MIDGFAERRARPYIAALEALAVEHGVEYTSVAQFPRHQSERRTMNKIGCPR